MPAEEHAALLPTTVPELVDAVRSAPRVIPMGGRTKPRLSAVGEEFTRISMLGLSGIIEYQPSEFTFTALAGTPVRTVVAALAERGQYLPFDPMLTLAGATLGGTLAAGLSGPGRVRYGAIRDFILGVRFVDGDGHLRRMGGKVVKNAAGFDLPKFLVGSAGRFGVVAEASFKVFPRPAASRTLRLEAADAAAKRDLLTAAAAGRWEFEAMDAAVGEGAIFVRLAGAAEALDPLAADVLARWPGSVMTPGDASHLWQSVTEFRWAHTAGTLAKIALTPGDVPAFVACIREQPEARGWISGGGSVGYLSVPSGGSLPPLPWPGMTLRGAAPLWLGPQARFAVMKSVKIAIDPSGRFPDLEEEAGIQESRK